MKSATLSAWCRFGRVFEGAHTVLVEEDDIAPSEVDGVGSAQAGNCSCIVSVNVSRCCLESRKYLRPAPTTITRGAMFGGIVRKRCG
jgi:hypothetical protein